MRQSPGADTPRIGHGFGLSWQKRKKSSASAGQDREVGLHETRRQARRRPGMRRCAGSRAAPRRRSAHGSPRLQRRRRHRRRRHAMLHCGQVSKLPAHFIINRRRKNGRRDDLTRGNAAADGAGTANSVETAVKIAFANGILLAKSPSRAEPRHQIRARMSHRCAEIQRETSDD